MKRFQLIIFLVITCAHSYAQTQADLNSRAADEFKEADNELNATYQMIMKAYADDPTFLSALRTSQRNWITFRDSELKMRYPDREPGWYGSIQPMCVSRYMAELTRDRTETLKQWLIGIEEGDACAGSVRYMDEPELLQEVQNEDLVRVLNNLTVVDQMETEELYIKVITTPFFYSDGTIADLEIKNMWIAVSEYSEVATESLYRLNNLNTPTVVSFTETEPWIYNLLIEHIERGEKQQLVLKISTEGVEVMSEGD